MAKKYVVRGVGCNLFRLSKFNPSSSTQLIRAVKFNSKLNNHTSTTPLQIVQICICG